MTIMKVGSTGSDVRKLQKRLQELNLYIGKIDGIFGRMTKRAVMSFQKSRGLLQDGIVGPQTLSALQLSLEQKETTITYPEPGDILPGHIAIQKCSKETWKRFVKFVELSKTPVVYGPGRGLFVDETGEYFDKWVITWGPGKLGSKGWAIKPGKTKGPSFHCSSLTNFLLGYLLNYNEIWTHSGNIPLLETLCTSDSKIHKMPKGDTKYRGYAEHILRLVSDGDTKERKKIRFNKVERYLDAIEIWERRKELSTFNFFSQGDNKNGRWNLDHHTGVFVFKHKENKFYRLAADGYRGGTPKAYSGTPVSFEELDENWSKEEKGRVYQIFRLIPDNPEGDFGLNRPSKNICLEF